MSFRKKIVWRAHEAVIRDIKKALTYGYDTIWTAFDPTPKDDTYYIKLFDKMAKEGLQKSLGWQYEATGLPS